MDLGKLYLIPTPIGNMGDMTERSLEILKEVEWPTLSLRVVDQNWIGDFWHDAATDGHRE